VAWNKSNSETSMYDMKSVLANTAFSIGKKVYDVTMSNNTESLRGWISEIECFEAQMSPYIDKKYEEDKIKCLERIKPRKGINPTKRQVFKAWLTVYGLLCVKMNMYGAYPLTPWEEVEEHDHPEYILEDEHGEELED